MSGKKILIAEDSRTQQLKLQMLLEQEGYDVVAASDGEEALNKLAEDKFDLLISDVMMPIINGFQLCKKIKGNNLLDYSLNVILITTLSELDDIAEALQSNADLYITKPFNSKFLLQKVKELLDNNYLVTESGNSIQIKTSKKNYEITSSKSYLLKLLISSWEHLITQNKELVKIKKDLRTLNQQLEKKVDERTETLVKEIRNRRKAEDEAKKSDQLKSEFLSRISHEIRTPLNAIVCYADIVKDLVKHPEDLTDDSELFDIMNGMDDSSRRLVRTIESIVELSQIHTGTYTFTKNKIVIDELLTDQINKFKSQAEIKGIELVYKNNLKAAQVDCDSFGLNNIFNNLIDNAIKFTKKGIVTVEVYKDQLHRLNIRFIDTGIGMNKEYYKNLFQPFSQEEQGFTRGYEGNGLGLALVSEYCKMNNIALSLKSEKGAGTEINLKFKNFTD